MATIIHINKDGVSTKLIEGDSSFPIIIMNPSSGYVSIDNYTIEWIGNNFKYTNGYIMPTSGTITGLSLRLIDTNEIPWSIACKYNIKSTDIALGQRQLMSSITNQNNIQWKGGGK